MSVRVKIICIFLGRRQYQPVPGNNSDLAHFSLTDSDSDDDSPIIRNTRSSLVNQSFRMQELQAVHEEFEDEILANA